MASLSYYGAFMFFLASTIASSALATSHYKINDPNCASAVIVTSLETFKNLTKTAIAQISNSSLDFATNGTIQKFITNTSPNDKVALSAMGSCRELFSMAIDNLNNSLALAETISQETLGNLISYRCFTVSNVESCIDLFNSSVSQIQDFVYTRLNGSLDAINKAGDELLLRVERCYGPAAFDSYGKVDHFVEQYYSTSDRNPSWLSSEDKELIQSTNIRPNIVVAQDGSGNYRTISDAIKSVPYNNNRRFYIYVKKGVYFENVKIDMNQWNVVLYGDGMNKTIISAKRSVTGGYDIFSSATFAVLGRRFIARDIGFFNTAGAINGQAAALLSASDRSVFYKCRIDGYQDTLNAQSGRQFYRECDIYGTIDFIFGNAAIIVQNSNIFAKRPLPGQGNAIAAHARTDPKCQTAIVIQSSNIKASEDLGGASTFLGRPWKTYSVVVYLENNMDNVISPMGWIPMTAMPPADTILLAEYGNKGPGSNVAGRVKWKGVRVDLGYNEAIKYTAGGPLLRGNTWLPGTNVSYNSGL